MQGKRALLAAAMATFGILPEECRVSVLEFSEERHSYPPKQKIILIGTPEKISMVRDVITTRLSDVSFRLGISEKEALELRDMLVEEYGLIFRSESFLDEVAEDIPKVLKAVDPDPEMVCFPRKVKRKMGRVNTTPFVSQKRIRRKH